MVSSLEKNKIYRLQFTIDAAGSGKQVELKCSINRDLCSKSRLWYNNTHSVFFTKKSNGGIGFAEAADGGQTVTFRIDDVSVKSFHAMTFSTQSDT